MDLSTEINNQIKKINLKIISVVLRNETTWFRNRIFDLQLRNLIDLLFARGS